MKTKFATAKLNLINDGWQFVCSVMHDGGATGAYGMLFTKDGAKQYLNKDTVEDILNPADGDNDLPGECNIIHA